MALSLPASRGASRKRENDQPSAWPDWSTHTAVCMASGPSLTVEDVELVKNQRQHGAQIVHTIAINDCGLARRLPLAAPWADILYAADAKWWRAHQPEFMDLRVSGELVRPVKNKDGRFTEVPTRPLKMLARGEPMPRTPGSVVSGNHSGFQALGLALSLGAVRILLLGYDCGPVAGKKYAHEDRNPAFKTESPHHTWLPAYAQVPGRWPKVEIINCSADSVIQVFQKRPLREVI